MDRTCPATTIHTLFECLEAPLLPIGPQMLEQLARNDAASRSFIEDWLCDTGPWKLWPSAFLQLVGWPPFERWEMFFDYPPKGKGRTYGSKGLPRSTFV